MFDIFAGIADTEAVSEQKTIQTVGMQNMGCLRIRHPLLAFAAIFCAANWAFAAPQYVITISVDGLGSSYLQTLMNSNSVPNFQRLKTEGAGTQNARDDYDYTVTLPNHVTMVTGRGIVGTAGHNWSSNSDPPVGATIQSGKGSYVASAFDVAHDNGLRTSMYAGKTKFSLFDTSYNATNGALDTTGADNGRDKLDVFMYNGNTGTLTSSFIAAMDSNPFQYSFLHFTDGDSAGHASGWGSVAYKTAIKNVDGYLGSIFNMIDNNATFQGKTAIVLTADHGGASYDHSNASDPLDYTIPFYVWGPGVLAGADLYSLNAGVRLDPNTGRPLYSAPVQPIRNGEVANLALDLLGLGPVPGSTLNFAQNLTVPEPSSAVLLLLAGLGLGWKFSHTRLRGIRRR